MPRYYLQIKLFLAIIFFASPISRASQAEISAYLEDTTAINALRFEHFNIGGNVNLMLTAIDEAGNTTAWIDGSRPFSINGNDTALTFYQGYALLPLKEERLSSLLIDYETKAGPQRFFKIYRTSGTRTTVSAIAPWTAILPPLLAIILALVFREVVVSLLAGVFAGVLLINGGNFFGSLTDLFDFYLLNSLADRSHVSIILFSLLLGGMVAVISRNGGMHGIVDKLSRLAKTARSTQLVTWLLGIAVFFDDYANTLVVGNTMRPVTDRFRISREKLAYIVDSTAAPVAAIAFITTWIGAELDYIQGAIVNTGIRESAYSIFLNSFVYSYYPLLTLAFVFMLIWLGRDYGGMRAAEIRARTTGAVFKKGKESSDKQEADLEALEPSPGIRFRWYNAFLPILTVILVTMIGLWQTGYISMKTDGHSYIGLFESLGFGERLALVFSSDFLSVMIGSADSYVALLWASSMGLLMAVLLSTITGTLKMRASIETMLEGFKTMLPAILILVLAWTLASVTEYMQTAAYLTSVFSDSLHIRWMPLITFLMAALISFSTGSSWSTMAILYPLLLPLTWSIGLENALPPDAIMPIFYNVTATVLAGSVFGDHCSPISDTTVLSSLACSCNHIDHVRTQLPYALTVGFASMVAGGLLAPIGLPFFVNFPIALLFLLGVIRFVGKPVPTFSGLSATHVDDEGIKTDSQ